MTKGQYLMFGLFKKDALRTDLDDEVVAITPFVQLIDQRNLREIEKKKRALKSHPLSPERSVRRLDGRVYSPGQRDEIKRKKAA